MKIVVIGGSGLIGSKLVSQASRSGATRSWRRRPTLGRQHASPARAGRGARRRPGRRRRGELALVRGQGGPGVLRDVRPQPARRGSGRRRGPSRRAVGRRHRPPAGERLPARQGGPGEADQSVSGSRTRSCARRSSSSSSAAIAEAGTDGRTVRLSPAFVQPIASDDVAAALADVAVAAAGERHGRGGRSGAYRLDELVREVLAADEDQRQVIADVHARYFGTELNDRSLTPGDHPRFAPTHFDDWLRDARAQM